MVLPPSVWEKHGELYCLVMQMGHGIRTVHVSLAAADGVVVGVEVGLGLGPDDDAVVVDDGYVS